MLASRNSVFLVNDDEIGLHHDYEVWLETLAPHAPIDQYWHNRTDEGHADAHLKRKVMGREVVGAVTNSRLDFGTWGQIFYGEFDGRRRKRVLVKIAGEQVRSELSCAQWTVALVCHNHEMICTNRAWADRLTLGPGLNCSLEPGSPIELC